MSGDKIVYAHVEYPVSFHIKPKSSADRPTKNHEFNIKATRPIKLHLEFFSNKV